MTQPSAPTGLAIDAGGRIFVSDPANGVVQGHGGAHTLNIQWGWSNAAHPLHGLKDPTGLAVDQQGTVYVVVAGNQRVVEFAAADLRGTSPLEGYATASWCGTTGPAPLREPGGGAVDARGDSYVADAAGPRRG